MDEITYEKVSEEQDWTVEELKRGYSLFLIDEGVEVIQKIDCLWQYGLEKFDNDTEAGKQALKDGYKLFSCEHEDLVGWYILDTPKNREIVESEYK